MNCTIIYLHAFSVTTFYYGSLKRTGNIDELYLELAGNLDHG